MARTDRTPRKPREGRRPLIAGNWKMNLTHLEAIGLVQKLAFSLTEQQLDAAEVVVLPPFTALRSVQTLVTGDKLEVGYGAQDLSAAGLRRLHRRDQRRDAGGAGLPVRHRRSLGAACAARRGRRAWWRPRRRRRCGTASCPIVCVGEGLDVRQAGGHVAHCTGQLDAALDGLTAEQIAARARHRDRLRAGLGDRHRRGGHPGGRAGGLRGAPGAARRAVRPGDGRRRPYPLRRVGEGREHGRDPGRAGHRRCARRRRQPGRRRVRRRSVGSPPTAAEPRCRRRPHTVEAEQQAWSTRHPATAAEPAAGLGARLAPAADPRGRRPSSSWSWSSP